MFDDAVLSSNADPEWLVFSAGVVDCISRLTILYPAFTVNDWYRRGSSVTTYFRLFMFAIIISGGDIAIQRCHSTSWIV
jgi:hypothetical protein